MKRRLARERREPLAGRTGGERRRHGAGERLVVDGAPLLLFGELTLLAGVLRGRHALLRRQLTLRVQDRVLCGFFGGATLGGSGLRCGVGGAPRLRRGVRCGLLRGALGGFFRCALRGAVGRADLGLLRRALRDVVERPLNRPRRLFGRARLGLLRRSEIVSRRAILRCSGPLGLSGGAGPRPSGGDRLGLSGGDRLGLSGGDRAELPGSTRLGLSGGPRLGLRIGERLALSVAGGGALVRDADGPFGGGARLGLFGGADRRLEGRS